MGEELARTRQLGGDGPALGVGSTGEALLASLESSAAGGARPRPSLSFTVSEWLVAHEERVGRLPLPGAFVAATLLVAAMLLLQYFTDTRVDGQRFIFSLPAVLLCALVLGRGTWIWAMVLSVVLGEFLFSPPAFSFGYDEPEDLVAALLFLGMGTAIAAGASGLKVYAAQLAEAGLIARQTAQKLAQLERQKTLLLSEINHRIKNDLNTLSSMLQLQARQQADRTAAAALETASGRIAVLGGVYDRLRLRDDGGLATVEAGEYLDRLCQGLRLSLVADRPIRIDLRADSCTLAIARAVPVGLIVNELVTNALKHGFPDGRPGCISVDLRRKEEALQLTVSDDGVGIGFQPGCGGLGTRLIGALVNQLQGSLRVGGPPGVSYVLDFPASE